ARAEAGGGRLVPTRGTQRPSHLADVLLAEPGLVQRAQNPGLDRGLATRSPVGPVVPVEPVEHGGDPSRRRQLRQPAVELGLAEVAAVGAVADVTLDPELAGVQHLDANPP